MQRIAMIPARLGSKRVPQKNIRILGDKPLLAWVVETALAAGLFDFVYVNSESAMLGALAEKLGARWYRRDPALAGDDKTSEDFVRDFIDHVDCDEVYQITPTSPFLTAEDMWQAVELMYDTGTVCSVKRVQAECVVRGLPVNFSPSAPMQPSQDLDPAFLFCNGVFGWRPKVFRHLQDTRGSATYGSWDADTTKFLVLEGDSTVDIDTEEDFAQAEAVLLRRRDIGRVPRYWSPSSFAQAEAARVLTDDGVDLFNPTRWMGDAINVYAILNDLPPGQSGASRIVQMPSSAATLITQRKGEGNRLHYHDDLDEWWLILEGIYDYEIEGDHRLVRAGDIVAIPRGMWHRIEAVSERATRLAVSRDAVNHIYSD